jgi:hypothetical protein
MRAHDLVRTEVLFGVTPYFEAVTPEQTLTLGVGHCNPKGHLFVTLLGELGIEARMHFVSIEPDILRGCFHRPLPLRRLSHAFSEVRLGGRWIRLDSYIVDPRLLDAGLGLLRAEGRELGYGVHAGAARGWDGSTDAFSQLAASEMVLEDHGTFEDPASFYRSPACTHGWGPLRVSHIAAPFRLLPRPWWNTALNGRLEALRRRVRAPDA